MIMRYLRLVLALVLGVGLLILAMANRALVTVHVLPGDLALLFGANIAVDVPLFVVIFAAILAGLMIGFVWEWLREHKIRAAASQSKKTVARLERDLAVLRDARSVPADDVLALLERPKSG
jgi:lipopolysaccharide assembly protein A